MKTTLIIDDQVMLELKREAARRRTTMSAVVESALRRELRRPTREVPLPVLPTFDSGGAMVDPADREALYQAMEGR
jgi:hypothetical protein